VTTGASPRTWIPDQTAFFNRLESFVNSAADAETRTPAKAFSSSARPTLLTRAEPTLLRA
jgi:hypothetical protein